MSGSDALMLALVLAISIVGHSCVVSTAIRSAAAMCAP